MYLECLFLFYFYEELHNVGIILWRPEITQPDIFGREGIGSDISNNIFISLVVAL